MTPKLHLYMNNCSEESVTQLLLGVLPGLELKDTINIDDTHQVKSYMSDNYRLIIHKNDELCWPLEVDIRGKLDNTELHAFDDLKFGEWMVDSLDCNTEAFADCGGKYNPPLSDWLVRITQNAVESVLIPEEGSAIDEKSTQVLASRGKGEN